MSNKMRKYIINNNLPIRIIFTPGQKLEEIFFVVIDHMIRNIVLTLDALFVPVFAITVTVKCWNACTK